jgi:phenylpropionate dioxygenase-like ring-hydroxylating dioxygenase large terminal subunit
MAMTKPARRESPTDPVEALEEDRWPVRIAKDRYVSDRFEALERERLWPRVWQMACIEADVARPGDYVEYEIGDQSVVVVRGDDSRLRAFHNVCQHRGNRVLKGAGNAGERIRCGYHCWTYDLDGSLSAVSDRKGFGDLDREGCSLTGVRVESWEGFVFVCLDPSVEPLVEFLGPLPGELARYHFGEMTRTVDITTPCSANWKVIVEAFLEVYHVQGIHPQLLPMLDDIHTTYENFGTHSRMVVPFGVPSPRVGDTAPETIFKAMLRAAAGAADNGERGPNGERPPPPEQGEVRFPPGLSAREFFVNMVRTMAEGKALDISALDESQLIDDWHYHIFPNLVFNTHAGGFLFFRIRPDGADRSLFDFMVFEWVPDADEVARRRARHAYYPELTHSLGEVLDQDLENLPGVQRGLHSDGLDHVTLSEQETRLVRFQRVVDRYLGA